MHYRFGWFSTGRDEAARELLQVVRDKMNEGFIPGELFFVFCNRERGEGEQSDLFLDLAESADSPVISLSSSRYKPDLRQKNLEEWRRRYHEEVMKQIAPFPHDMIVLAGYMLIVSPQMCRRHHMINLHPALPDGPTGAWEDVIDELIQQQSDTTGVMMHLVTEDLDRGPVVAYCAFPIRGSHVDYLWRKKHTERGALFWYIRHEGVRREIPLIVLTLKALGKGSIRIEGGRVMNQRGEEQLSGVSLTDEVEHYLQGMQ